MDDFDNDGNLDLMICAWGLRDQLRYFHNNGNGTFTDRTEAAGLMGELGGLNMVQADYNNDGFLDVLVLRGAWWEAQGHHPNSLLRNNGDGTFEDVTEAAGLLSFQLNHRHGRRSRWSFQNAKSRAWSRSCTERSIDGTRRSGSPRGGT